MKRFYYIILLLVVSNFKAFARQASVRVQTDEVIDSSSTKKKFNLQEKTLIGLSPKIPFGFAGGSASAEKKIRSRPFTLIGIIDYSHSLSSRFTLENRWTSLLGGRYYFDQNKRKVKGKEFSPFSGQYLTLAQNFSRSEFKDSINYQGGLYLGYGVQLRTQLLFFDINFGLNSIYLGDDKGLSPLFNLRIGLGL